MPDRHKRKQRIIVEGIAIGKNYGEVQTTGGYRVFDRLVYDIQDLHYRNQHILAGKVQLENTEVIVVKLGDKNNNVWVAISRIDHR